MHMHSRNSTCPDGATPDMMKDQVKKRREGTNRGVPPAIHKVHSRCLRQVERHTASLQTDKEYSDMYVIH
jgi:hypothetical protein